MIVETSGTATVRVNATGGATMIVSTTGTAYVKKGVIKTVMRFFRRTFAPVKKVVQTFKEKFVQPYMTTKNGLPSSIEPPAANSF